MSAGKVSAFIVIDCLLMRVLRPLATNTTARVLRLVELLHAPCHGGVERERQVHSQHDAAAVNQNVYLRVMKGISVDLQLNSWCFNTFSSSNLVNTTIHVVRTVKIGCSGGGGG